MSETVNIVLEGEYGPGGDWDAEAHIRLLRANGGASSGYTADFIERLAVDLHSAVKSLRSHSAVVIEQHTEITRLTARIAELEKALDEEELSHEQTVSDRDTAEETADQLVERIEALLCVDCGEHSNRNNPWQEACDYLDGAIRARTTLSASQDAKVCSMCGGQNDLAPSKSMCSTCVSYGDAG